MGDKNELAINIQATTTNASKVAKAKVAKGTEASTVDVITQHHSRTSTDLPDGWNKHTDTTSGRRYYAGAGGQSQWKPPPGSTGGSVDDAARGLHLEKFKTNPLQKNLKNLQGK